MVSSASSSCPSTRLILYIGQAISSTVSHQLPRFQSMLRRSFPRVHRSHLQQAYGPIRRIIREPHSTPARGRPSHPSGMGRTALLPYQRVRLARRRPRSREGSSGRKRRMGLVVGPTIWMSPFSLMRSSRGIEQTTMFTRKLVEIGIDLIDVSSGGNDTRQNIQLGPSYRTSLSPISMFLHA